jgi:23S rRNA (uracil1939-C5)-methyltransferase
MARGVPREIEVHVDALSVDGLGEGSFAEPHVAERRVAVRNALPGETVTVRVLKRRRGRWFGEAAMPVQASPLRRPAPCAAYPRCAGCVLQHLDHAAQLAHKQRVLLACLAEHGVTPASVRAPVAGPQFHYRYKARLGVRLVGGQLLVGFREGFSNRIVRMTDCKTLALPFANALPALQRTLAGLAQPHRIPQVELAAGDHSFAVIVRHLDALDAADRARLQQFSADRGFLVYLQGAGYDSVVPLDGQQDQAFLTYDNVDYGLSYEFLPTDFTQVNPYINRALVRAAMLALRPRSGAGAIDLFCGIGNFSLVLARLGLRVRGFEASAAAVERAQHNARRNGVDALAEFAVADLYDSRCPDLSEAEYLVLDPPRSGAGGNLSRWLAGPQLERVAYVSCNPRTFASDAAVLQQAGFALQQVGVFDMFPHTAHIETLGLFVRKPGVRSLG